MTNSESSIVLKLKTNFTTGTTDISFYE